MSTLFVSGMLTAWAMAHLGLGIFFGLAYLVRKHEPEYLIFSLLSAALSVMTFGIALDTWNLPIALRYVGDQVAHMAAILAAVLNLHFALAAAFPGQKQPLIRPLYVLSVGFVLADWLGLLWLRESHAVVEAHAFGLTMRHALGRLTVAGELYYAVTVLETLGAFLVLLVGYLRGKHDVLTTLIAAFLVVMALVNDVLVSTNLIHNSLLLLPHVFMLYALGAAITLLFRYRAATGALESTADSLRQRTEELRHSYAELAQLQNELSTKKQLAAVGELAAAIAHEVRNPLAVIVNAVSGLRRLGIRDEDRTMLLDIVDEEAGRLNRLVTDLLRFARPVNVKRSPVSLVELANRCRANASDGFDVRVDVSHEFGNQTVEVDPNLFRLVLDNLVANACQAMGDSGIVQIQVSRGEMHGLPAARIEIRDHGHGMERQVLERALDPFFTTRPSGTGLGLPIVHRIVEAHGGELLIESTEGEGTRVTLTVPTHGPVREAAAPVEATA